MPRSMSARVNARTANSVGSSTTTFITLGAASAAYAPITRTLACPLESRRIMRRSDDAECGAPVTTSLDTVNSPSSGETRMVAGSPGLLPALISRSMTLSFTTIGEMTTPVPSSRSPAGKRLTSTRMRPSTRVMPFAAICAANSRITSSGSPIAADAESPPPAYE